MGTRVAHNKRWTKELVIAEAQKYQSQAEWRKAGGGSMGAARENGWIQEATAHMVSKQKPNGYWTKERVLEEAKKYSYQTEWSKAGGGSFSMAQKKKWLAEACAHMKSPKVPMGFWTKERLIEDAKKYKSRVEWKKANGSAYATARNNKWLDECCAHMEFLQRPSGYWTKERVLESALNFQSSSQWLKNDRGAWAKAQASGWLEEATSHMPNRQKKKAKVAQSTK